MLRIATPLVMAEIGWVSMGVVDTMMVGRLPGSAAAIGAVSLATVIFYTVAIYGSALLLGLDTLVSQAYGAGDLDRCNRALWSGVWLSVPVAPAILAIVWGITRDLHRFGVRPEIAAPAEAYLAALKWSAIPLLLYSASRRYLQAVGGANAVMFALISANLVNAGGNWALIYGHLGLPALGVTGSAWATVAARVHMAVVLFAAILWRSRTRRLHVFRHGWRPDRATLTHLVRLGFPAATHVALEIGVFAAATGLISTISANSIAAHQVALNTASFTFMIPLGISAAAAVRVGHEIGRGRPDRAGRAGWIAISMGAAFMSLAAVAFLTVPRWIARFYTPDPKVIEAAVPLFAIAAAFQLFDGLQIVCAGALRGSGDTRTPMLANLGFYWFFGLPLGWLLGFPLRLGAVGVWIGLCVALIAIGTTLVIVWYRRTRVRKCTSVSIGV